MLQNYITNVRESLIKMASLVDYSLETLFFACEHVDVKGLGDRLLENEEQVNSLYDEIDFYCLDIFENQAPKGKALRFVLASMKMSHELERMSDQLVNILRSVTKVPGHQLLIIKEMMKEISNMLRLTTDAYVLQRSDLAEEAIKLDINVNEANRRIIKNFLKARSEVEDFQEGYHTTRMAKALERIGDHVKNMAEEIIFIEEGREGRPKDSDLDTDINTESKDSTPIGGE